MLAFGFCTVSVRFLSYLPGVLKNRVRCWLALYGAGWWWLGLAGAVWRWLALAGSLAGCLAGAGSLARWRKPMGQQPRAWLLKTPGKYNRNRTETVQKPFAHSR